MIFNLLFSQQEDPYLQNTAAISMHRFEDSTEDTGIAANEGNLGHRKRLAKLWEELASARPRLCQPHLPLLPPVLHLCFERSHYCSGILPVNLKMKG